MAEVSGVRDGAGDDDDGDVTERNQIFSVNFSSNVVSYGPKKMIGSAHKHEVVFGNAYGRPRGFAWAFSCLNILEVLIAKLVLNWQ